MNRMAVAQMTFESKDKTSFRDAFERACSHIPCGVAILTGTDPQDGPFGMTVSSLAFVSAEPPLVSVGISSKSKSLEIVRQNRHFTVNLLSDDQAALAAAFATPGANRFRDVYWRAGEDGSPILDNTIGAFCCERRSEVEAGDHHIVIGEVNRILLHGGTPLVHWRRAFHCLRVEYPFLASEATLEDFIERWKGGKLPKIEWTHGAHVGTAAYYAFELEAEALFARMKSGITYHNECVGTANTEDNGYHETLTRFWASTIGEFVRRGDFSTRFEAVKQATRVFGEDRDRHRLYYGFDVVRDRRARREWIPPDRNPPIEISAG